MANGAFDIDKVVSMLGDYHRKNYNKIVQKYQESFNLSSVFPVLSMVQDELVVTESIMNEIMQPYQSQFTVKGTLKFTPEILKTRYAKADVTLDPLVFRATHLADYLRQAPSEEHELVRLAYQEYMKRAAYDTSLAMIKGKYKAPTAGTAGAAVDVCDGYLEFLAKAITAKKLTPVTTGNITEDNIIDQVEAIYMSIPEDRRTGDLRCYMSRALHRMYFRAIRDRFGTNTDYKGWDGYVDGTDIPVVALPFMGNSNRIVFTFNGNFRSIQLQPGDLFKFEAQKRQRLIDFMMDWSVGFGAMIVGLENGTVNDQYIWLNDTDTPTESSGTGQGQESSGAGSDSEEETV